jgi:predicted metal-dependent phosphoesterase TrpH
LKIDMHVHTCYSVDSVITLEQLVFCARRRGLNGVAITDHDRLDSALKMASETDLLIIPGIEISSSDGHIVGLNVAEPIPRKLDTRETVNKIHEAGGIAVASHPISLLKGSLRKHVDSGFDAVEAVNSSAIPFSYAVKQSMRMASRLRKPCIAGSDAHYGPEIGYAFTVLNAEPNVDDVVKAIGKGLCQPFGKPIPLAVRLKRIIEVNRKRL